MQYWNENMGSKQTTLACLAGCYSCRHKVTGSCSVAIHRLRATGVQHVSLGACALVEQQVLSTVSAHGNLSPSILAFTCRTIQPYNLVDRTTALACKIQASVPVPPAGTTISYADYMHQNRLLSTASTRSWQANFTDDNCATAQDVPLTSR